MQVVYCRAFVAQKTATISRSAHKDVSGEQETDCLPLSQISFCSSEADAVEDKGAVGIDEPLTGCPGVKKGRLSSWKRRAAARVRQRQDSSPQNGESNRCGAVITARTNSSLTGSIVCASHRSRDTLPMCRVKLLQPWS